MSRTRPSRWWRVLVYFGVGLVVLLALLYVALKTSFAREQIRTQTNSALAGVFQGRLVVERLGYVGLDGLRGVDLRVFDARGQQVVQAQGVSVSASVPSLVWQLLANSERPELHIASVHVEHVDVGLREDAELGVTLASAFMPRDSSEPPPPSPPDSGPRLRIEQISAGSVWAHGRASGSPPLDAELRRLRASLSQSPVDGLLLDIRAVELVTRGLPLGADPRGAVTALVESPAEGAGPLRLGLTLEGQAAGSPLSLEASWVGDDLHARVLLPALPASFINQQAPGLGLEGHVALAAEVDGPLPQLDFTAEIDAEALHLNLDGYAVVAEGFELGATVVSSRLDLARLGTGLPETELDLTAQVLLLERADAELVGAYRVDLGSGRVGTDATPPLWVSGRMTLEDGASLDTSGKLGVDEPGASLLGSYRVSLPEKGSSRIVLSLDTELEDPARLRQLGIRTAGMASVSAELHPEQGKVTARASMSLRRVDHETLQVRNVEVRAQVSGSLDDPRVHAAATLDVLSGRAHADLEYSAKEQDLKLFVVDVDLPRLSRSLGTELPIEQGVLSLDARVNKRSSSPTYALDAKGKADFGPLGNVKLEAKQLEVPARMPTLAQLAAIHGELRISGKVELEALAPILTNAQLPIERTTGHVRFEAAAIHRARADGLELSMSVDTNGLRVVQVREASDVPKTTSDAIAAQPLAIEGIDLHLSAHGSPRTGEAVATLLLRDRGGLLAELQAEAQLGGLSPTELLDAQTLSGVPLRATLQVPTRRLQSLPPLLRPLALRGRLTIDAGMAGSVREPRFQARATVQRMRAAGSKNGVDAVLDLDGSMQGGKVAVHATLPGSQREVLAATTTWLGDLRRAGGLMDGTSGITASASAKLSEFPFDVVPQLIDRQIEGTLSGELELADWGRDARLDASFVSTSLSFGRIPIQRLQAKARTEARKLLAEVRMNVGSGTSEVTLDAGVDWGAAALPRLEHEGRARLVTRAFKVETLSPLLTAYVSEVGGVLDADTELVVTPTSTQLSGRAKLEKGVLQLPAIGQRFSDVTARVSVDNDQFKLEELRARGTTGRLLVTGAARLDGFELRGADARVTINENEAVPLTLEGSAIGDAWGTIEAKYASPKEGERTLDVDIPQLQIVTPETGGGSVQSLEDDPEIRVGVHRADGKFVALPLQPLPPSTSTEEEEDGEVQPLRIRVKLGNNVRVQRDRTATVLLTGQITVLVASETEVEGRLELRGGKLDVQGKTFEIERGVITFDGGDPSNPTITATARWDAPGYTVYAEYLGDVENGRIKLRSEPPLTASEIASLLLFGSPEGSPAGSGGNSNAALAIGVAGDTAAQGLNQALDDFTSLDVSARIDTTTGSARPELVFQVSPRVSAKVTRAIGTPAYGESPDRTFLTLELRLRRSWALSTMFGDRGASALELIWRRRY